MWKITESVCVSSVRLQVVTWNVATAEPPEDVTSLLQLDVQPPTDLYVIGWEREASGKSNLSPPQKKQKQASAFVERRMFSTRGLKGVCLWAGVFCLCQAAGGERRSCEVHRWHAAGGFLEPCLHGHPGAQRLRQGETGAALVSAGSDGACWHFSNIYLKL